MIKSGMARAAVRSHVVAAEYLAWEREQPQKHEFFYGEVFAMSGSSPRHNALGAAATSELRAALRGRCVVLSSDQRVACPPGERYVYPDAVVVCGTVELQAGTRDVITNPTILVEVISSSTEDYDRGVKWLAYQSIPSLTDYLLVAQASVRVDHYRRNTDGTWTYRALGAGERVVLDNGAELDLDRLYADVLALPGE